ncbi:MAG: glycosyltransferase family 2 protein [Candidatus Buchananbacteria bacterium]|nr:glycosyltransferase family 2 protein [Candidatus Buchananbacteria bacterium]
MSVTLIIPAHNEADNISSVLETATKSKFLDEIIVVADACSDTTAELARSFGVTVIEKATTRGKGDAMIHGVQQASGDILMFADADLKGFTTRHIQQVLEPVIKGKVTMSVGLRDRALGLGALIPKVAPTFAIGGERAMTRKFFDSLPKDQNLLDFGIETVMNYYAKMNRLRVAYPVLKNLKHTIKEKKWGWQDGVKQRMKLNRQVLRARKMMKQRAKSV